MPTAGKIFFINSKKRCTFAPEIADTDNDEEAVHRRRFLRRSDAEEIG
jgi:hypothetical protein